jgi:Domain of unknown function (DUF4388)
MKLLIIASPYEADRIRRAAVSAGFETVAVEPGESLSGWISASRPDLIVMAPQIVNPDPAVALAKVRAVPRGRVPIFLVGEAADEARMRGLGDGFFVRPVSTGELVAAARARLGRGRAGTGSGAGGESGIPTPITDGGSADFARGGGTPRSAPGREGGQGARPTLKPLVSAADASGPVKVPKARPSEAGALFVKLAESIDATLDAEMRDVARSIGAMRREAPDAGSGGDARTVPSGKRPPMEELERTPMAPMTALAAAAALADDDPEHDDAGLVSAREALAELRDETSQKTVEVPRDLFARMTSDRTNAGRKDSKPGALAPIESGKIADNDVAALLGRMVMEKLTGRLSLGRDGVEKAIYFDAGAPMVASSTDVQDRMGEMLVRQGRLTDVQQAQGVQALAAAAKSGQRLGAALAELGIIKLSELPLLVRRHYEEIIHSVFAWEEGEWRLGPDRPPKEESVVLADPPGALILEGIRRKYSAGRLRRCLGGGGQVFRLPGAAGTSAVLQRMGLYHDERAVVPLFDGVRTLDEVCALSSAPEEVVCGVAWALSVLGRFERVDARSEDAAGGEGASPRAAGAIEPARDGGGGPPDRDRDIDRARVLARHALVEEGDYFQVLGLARTATAHEVRRAHRSLMREFAPAVLDAELAAELGTELAAIRAVLDEALRVLGESRMRERYQSHLPPAASRRIE